MTYPYETRRLEHTQDGRRRLTVWTQLSDDEYEVAHYRRAPRPFGGPNDPGMWTLDGERVKCKGRAPREDAPKVSQPVVESATELSNEVPTRTVDTYGTVRWEEPHQRARREAEDWAERKRDNGY